MKARTDALYIYDILECCKKIEEYISGIDQISFDNNRMMQDAVVRNIEIIGEAAKALSPESRDATSEIEWREIMRMRDKIVHHYFRIDLETVWQTAKTDVPALAEVLQRIDPGSLESADTGGKS